MTNTMKYVDPLTEELAQAPAGTALSSISREEFGKRLYGLMVKQGWNQSELGRRAGLERSVISSYIRGLSFPSPQNLQKLATVLKVRIPTLLPNYLGQAVDSSEDVSFELKSISGTDKMRVKINHTVSRETAIKLSEIMLHESIHNPD